jgi:predicted MFS family arabinose efflux permease
MLSALLVLSTRSIFLWTRVLNVPFWAILSLLAFILYRDLHANAWQITLFVTIKPLTGCFAFYWGSTLKDRPDRLRSNLIAANILKYLPFLAFPWLDNVWALIAASACYMTLMRGATPAWIEILKLSSTRHERDTTFATGSVIDYIGGCFLPLLLAWLIDDYPGCWRWIFFITAILGITSTLLLYKLPINAPPPPVEDNVAKPPLHNLTQPLRDTYQLLYDRPDFTRFQIGFMFGGTGLILLQPALSSFFVDHLHLSYTEITTALIICKGVGFAITTPGWLKLFHNLNLFRFCSSVTLLATLFPLCLIAASWHTSWLYSGYLLYGVMQAGSELSWHMSAPLFAHQKDSSPFTNSMLLATGLRGCLAPLIGGLILASVGANAVFVCSTLCCLIATVIMWSYRNSYVPAVTQEV